MQRRTNYVKFTRLNKLADDLEKMVTTRSIDFGDLVGKELNEAHASKTFQQTLRRVILKIDEVKELAYKEEMDLVLAPLLKKANGDAFVLQKLISDIVSGNELASAEETIHTTSEKNVPDLEHTRYE